MVRNGKRGNGGGEGGEEDVMSASRKKRSRDESATGTTITTTTNGGGSIHSVSVSCSGENAEHSNGKPDQGEKLAKEENVGVAVPSEYSENVIAPVEEVGADAEAETQAGMQSKGKAKAQEKGKSPPSNFSRVNPALPRSELAERFPLFVEAQECTVEVTAGQMLYLPAGWFHEVSSLSSLYCTQIVLTDAGYMLRCVDWLLVPEIFYTGM